MQKVSGFFLLALIMTAVQIGCDSDNGVSSRDPNDFQPLKVERSNRQPETSAQPVNVEAPGRTCTCIIEVVPADARVLIEPEPVVSSSRPGVYQFQLGENASFKLSVSSEGSEKFQQVIVCDESDLNYYISLAPDFRWWLADAQGKFESGDLLGAWSSLGVAKSVNMNNVSTEKIEQDLRHALTAKEPEAAEHESSKTEIDSLSSARRLIDARSYDAAILLINARLAEDPQDLDASALLGYCFLKRGRIHEAVQALSEVIDLRPDYYLAIFHRGVAMVELAQPDQAIEDFRRCFELTRKPTDSLHYYLGLSLEQLGRTDEAVENYSSALLINPDHTAARLNRCILLLGKGSADAAIEDASTILAKQPSHAVALNSRGVAYTVRGETGPAIDDFSAAIAADPNYVEPRYNRALSYLDSNDYRESVEDFSDVIQSDPDSPEFRIGRAQAWMQIGEFQKANDDLLVALERSPEDPDAIQLQKIVTRSMNPPN